MGTDKKKSNLCSDTADFISPSRLHAIMQTCHSTEMKNLDLTNKKSGSGGKKIGIMVQLATKRNNSSKVTTICTSFLLISRKECFELSQQFVLFSPCLFCLCVLFLFSCLFAQTSQELAELFDFSLRIFLAKFLSQLLLFCRRKRRDEPR